MFLCPYVSRVSGCQTTDSVPVHYRIVISLKKAVNTDFTGIIRLDYQHIYIH